MRWQPQRAMLARSKLCNQLERIAIATGYVGAFFLCLGWWNLHDILTMGGAAREPMLALADEQAALINIFQPITLVYAAVLCGLCARFEERLSNRRAFIFLSTGFLLLAVGEMQPAIGQPQISSHSIYIHRIHSFNGTENPFATIAPLLAFPIGAGLYLARFLRRLPGRHSLRFLACGVVYVTGALVVEMISQSLAIDHGNESAAYLITAGIEESLETAGIIGFCLSLSAYMREKFTAVRFVTP